MPSFGEKLKLEREKRKITLEEISSTTKIGTRMLQALEEQRFSQLPGGIFNKGFVRAYARVLGLDEDQTVAEYLEASGEAPRVDPGSRENVRENSREQGSRSTPLRITDESSGRLEIRAELASRQLPWGIFAVILLIIALGLSLWNYRRLERQRTSNQPKVTQHAEMPAAPETTAAPGANPAPTNVNSSAQALPVGSPADSPAASSAAATGEKPPASSPAEPKSDSSATAPAPGEFVVTVRAREESWLSVVVDSKPVGSETVPAGTERTYHAHKLVIVKAGNSGVIDIRLNGKPLPPAGDVGEVKTVTIGPAGFLPSASSPLAP